jgi:hypothetical protein
MDSRIGRPSPALIIAIVALIVSLSGSAVAAKKVLDKNSVGTKQIKNGAVTTGKIANNAVTGAKVALNTLTGDDINIGSLGVVPSATNATNAGNATTVGSESHGATCPASTTLIRGTCYDVSLNPQVPGVKAAATQCAAKGGYLPTPMELYSIRTVINLGEGTPPEFAVSDDYYADNFAYKTIVVDGGGKMQELPVESPTQYICAYKLVR